MYWTFFVYPFIHSSILPFVHSIIIYSFICLCTHAWWSAHVRKWKALTEHAMASPLRATFPAWVWLCLLSPFGAVTAVLVGVMTSQVHITTLNLGRGALGTFSRGDGKGRTLPPWKAGFPWGPSPSLQSCRSELSPFRQSPQGGLQPTSASLSHRSMIHLLPLLPDPKC